MNISIPNHFVIVWEPIISRRHSAVSLDQMESSLKNFAAIPRDRKFRIEDNKRLMAAVTEEELRLSTAVAALQRRKAADVDGLYNDFYRDLSTAMVPRLVGVCNELLQGHKPPYSFLKAVVIPLRKKGDSPNALDYRLISLLQTSYKLFAKVLAQRLCKGRRLARLCISVGSASEFWLRSRIY